MQQNRHSHKKKNPVMIPILGISEWIDVSVPIGTSIVDTLLNPLEPNTL